MVNVLNFISIVEWYVTRFVAINGYQQGISCNEIGLCAQIYCLICQYGQWSTLSVFYKQGQMHAHLIQETQIFYSILVADGLFLRERWSSSKSLPCRRIKDSLSCALSTIGEQIIFKINMDFICEKSTWQWSKILWKTKIEQDSGHMSCRYSCSSCENTTSDWGGCTQ